MLVVSVLAVSDTGSVSISMMNAPDLSQRTCFMIRDTYFSRDGGKVINGHQIEFKPKAECVATGGPVIGQMQDEGRIPPPVAGMINGFMNGFRVQ
jgi:hypothetical protein